MCEGGERSIRGRSPDAAIFNCIKPFPLLSVIGADMLLVDASTTSTIELMTTTVAKQQLSTVEKDAQRLLFSALDPFTAVYSIMPLQQAKTFLLVAMEEGLGVGEYARRAGANPTVMTRHMLDLGEMNRRHEPGLNLVVTRPNPMNRRMHQVFLTPKGVALAHAITRALTPRVAKP